MQKRLVALSLFCLVTAGWLSGNEILEYQEKTGDQTAVHRFVIEKVSGGYKIQLTSTFPDKVFEQVFYVDGSLKSTGWEFSDEKRNIKVSAKKSGKIVILTGIHRGENIRKEFPVKGEFWNQTFNFGLRDFALGESDKIRFCAIGVDGPGEMKMGKFTVTREGTEKTMVNGEEVETIRIKITLSGMLSVFWHGDYWYRKTDGRFLRYRGKNAPRQPVSESQLVQETTE